MLNWLNFSDNETKELDKKGKNTFSGRITELLDSGLIKELDNNFKYTYYEIVYNKVEQELKGKRKVF
jgi:acetyl-CoA carboxylase carboxyltransferase component